MKRMLGIAALATMAASMPANAAQVGINFTGSSATSGTDGNARIFTGAANGTTVRVRATGWSLEGNTLRDSYLGAFGGGLGVTSGDENGSGNTHVIDNQNRYDFVILQFDQAVQLTAATFNGFAFGGTTDTDASIYWGNSNVAWNAGLGFNNQASSALGALLNGSAISAGGSGGTRNLNLANTATGNLWLVGAAFMNPDAKIDGFKLGGLTVKTVSPVPEPSSWALMLAGFALVAVAMRRAIRTSEQRFTDKVRRIATSGI
jgi:hypothetical protein